MTTMAFPASRINRLRSLAAKARSFRDDQPIPEDWSKSSVDPAKVVDVFGSLRMKEGYILRAYQFRAGGTGNGFVWALPEDAPFPETEECPRLEGHFLGPPKPLAALDDFMDALEGDRSPFSYLCASVLKRELEEFGAMWHGCDWSTHTILGSDLFVPKDRHAAPFDQPVTDLGEWYWHEAIPDQWRPRVEHDDRTGILVRFLTFSALGEQKVMRHEDRYSTGSYRFDKHEKVLGTGPGGFVF